MNRMEQLSQDPLIQTAVSRFIRQRSELEDLIVAIQQIPSPTFAEKERAAFIETSFLDVGLQLVEQDSMHNVFGMLPGISPESSQPIILSAHSDTVFPLGTDLSVRREDGKLYGPGIGDNAAGVAGLIYLAKTMRMLRIQPDSDIWFVSNVSEEGLGDLRGMRVVVQRFGSEAIYIVVEGGSYGQIMHEAIGVRRFRVEIETRGGHSWGSFGQPSAVHEMGHLISDLDEIKVPSKPRTTYNVGLVKGGTTVNSVAAYSSILLDLRSEDASELERLVKKVNSIISDKQLGAKRSGKEISYRVEPVGNRPAGRISRDDPLIQAAEKALEIAGCSPIVFIAGSTDANIPLSMGIRSVCVGLTYSANSHRQDEYIKPDYLPNGLQQLLLLSLTAARQ